MRLCGGAGVEQEVRERAEREPRGAAWQGAWWHEEMGACSPCSPALPSRGENFWGAWGAVRHFFHPCVLLWQGSDSCRFIRSGWQGVGQLTDVLLELPTNLPTCPDFIPFCRATPPVTAKARTIS